MNIGLRSVNYSSSLVCQKKVSGRNMVKFGANIEDIKAETFKAADAKKLCPGKTGFILGLSTFFESIKEKLPNNFEFKLDSKNNYPKELSEIKGNLGGQEVTLGEIDEVLNKDTFRCSPTSTCNCGKGMSKGQFLTLLFEKVLKLENPEKIELNND